mmetsp:Transcript_50292/g.126234  ORF Transcript_50292/g.126234 Transcript_50292/m.126234 type:complete len:162 (-) Transcript_50292:503-988(-)
MTFTSTTDTPSASQVCVDLVVSIALLRQYRRSLSTSLSISLSTAFIVRRQYSTHEIVENADGSVVGAAVGNDLHIKTANTLRGLHICLPLLASAALDMYPAPDIDLLQVRDGGGDAPAAPASHQHFAHTHFPVRHARGRVGGGVPHRAGGRTRGAGTTAPA